MEYWRGGTEMWRHGGRRAGACGCRWRTVECMWKQVKGVILLQVACGAMWSGGGMACGGGWKGRASRVEERGRVD